MNHEHPEPSDTRDLLANLSPAKTANSDPAQLDLIDYLIST